MNLIKSILPLFYFLFFTSLPSFGFQGILDSLNALPADTNLVFSYLDCANKNRQTDVILSEKCTDLGIKLATSVKFHKGLAEISRIKGNILGSRGKNTEAIALFKEVITLADSIGEIKTSLNAKMNLASSYASLRKSELALTTYNKCLTDVRALKSETGEIAILMQIGSLYLANGDHRRAHDYYLTAEKLLDKHKAVITNQTYYITLYNQMASLLGNIKDYEGSKEYFIKSLSYIKEKDTRRYMIYNNLGKIFLETEQRDSAHFYYSKTMNGTNVKDISKSHAYMGLIDMAFEDQDYRKVLIYAEEGLKIADKIDKANLKSYYSVYLGKYYQVTGQYQKAIKILSTAEKDLENIEDKRTLMNCKDHLLMANLSHTAPNQSALFTEYKALRDTMYDEQLVNQIKELNLKYETEKKEQEILLLEKENELTKSEAARNKVIGLAASLLLLLIAGIAYLLFYRERSNKEAAEQKREMIERIRKAENHVVDNTFGLIIGNLEEQEELTKNKETHQAIQKTKSLVFASSSVYNTIKIVEDDTSMASQNFRLGFIDLCEKLTNLANETRATKVNIICDEGIHVGKDIVRPLFLAVEELFTNSVKHAFTNQEHPEINVSLKKLDESTIQLLYSDNGAGVAETQKLSSPKPEDFEILDSLISKLKGKTSIENLKGLAFKFNFDQRTFSIS